MTAAPSELIFLEGTVSSVIYRNEENGYTILRLDTPDGDEVTVVGTILFVVVFFIGHALNFALNLIGCFVHTLRLQFLEFFGKWYRDGGRPFRPLHYNTKFVDIKED